jgi:predicted HAD superfamily Cof-like phosphohydrolase
MNTQKWFEEALPNPTPDNFRVQLGCHLEEVFEMLDSLTVEGHWKVYHVQAMQALGKFADALKAGYIKVEEVNVKEFVDSWADQMVTLKGLAHIAKIQTEAVIAEVDRSNFSKFVDGKPVFNQDGKITKGQDYSPPNLEPHLPTKVFWK